jgi:hypothetical protein
VTKGRLRLVAAALAPLLLGCQALAPCAARPETVAVGLTHPRGIARSPLPAAGDGAPGPGSAGALYVAEAGTAELGGRVSRIDRSGQPQPIATGLPHSINAGTEDVGPAGLAFRGEDLYLAQGEASGDLASALLRLPMARPGVPEKAADLAAFEQTRNPDDAEVGSNPFGLLHDAAEDAFYLTDAGGNSLLRVSPGGEITPVAVWRDGAVPTGLARGADGALYVALFSRFPHQAGRGRVDRVGPDGAVATTVDGLTQPIAVGFAPDGSMLVLEFASRFQTRPSLAFAPTSGRLLRLRDGRREVVARRLPFPTAMLVDGDGAVLISLGGAVTGPGRGSIARLVLCP